MLVATDFSKPARNAYMYALKLASLAKSRLTLLHVIKAPPGFEGWSPTARRSLEPFKTKALLELGRLSRLAHEGGVIAQHRLAVGIPVDSILEVAGASRTNLVVIGTNGRTGWNRLMLGSTAEAILREAPCPVLTVHAAIGSDSPVNPRRLNLHRFLVATDFSTSSEAALQYGAMLAERLNARIVLVHACKPLRSAQSGQTAGGASEGADQPLRKAMSVLHTGKIIKDRIILPGDPVEIILGQAKSITADLIVMGTHGRRGLPRLILGSIAESVIRRAECPVLIVKAGARGLANTSKGQRRTTDFL